MTLKVEKRDAKRSPDSVRAGGHIPAVLYGAKQESTPIAVSRAEFERLFRAAGETTVVTLEGLGDGKDTLIHDVQFHPVTGVPLHVDFYALEKGKKVELNIPLEFAGQAPAEKVGHIVVKALHEIEIEVAPNEIPHSLSVDLSALENVGDHIVASQIKLPASATLITDPEEIVASVTEFKEEKEEAPAPSTEAAPAEGAAQEVAPAGEKTE